MVKAIGDVSIKFNIELFFLNHFVVSLLDFGSDPICEYVLKHGGKDIANPLPRYLVDLLLIGYVIEDMHVPILYKQRHLLDREILVIRNAHMPYFVCFDLCRNK